MRFGELTPDYIFDVEMAKMYECLPNRILASIFCTDKKPTNIKHSCPCQPLHLFIKSSKPKTTSQFITIWPPQLIHHHQNLEQQIKNEPRPRHSVFGASKTTSTSGSTTDGRLEDWRLLKSTFLGSLSTQQDGHPQKPVVGIEAHLEKPEFLWVLWVLLM